MLDVLIAFGVFCFGLVILGLICKVAVMPPKKKLKAKPKPKAKKKAPAKKKVK